jgi:probable FeS assembly SUF system protein SufT
MTQEIALTRDTNATAIPAGTPTVLASGTSVFIAQTLGGNVTVRTEDGLFRIDAGDVDALGPDFSTSGPAGEAATSHGTFSEQAVWEALKTCYDPEIPVNIVDLGLVYDLVVEPTTEGKNNVAVKMTLTAPGCGMGPVIANDARSKILALPEVDDAQVVIVWDPVWSPQMISAEGRQILGLE